MFRHEYKLAFKVGPRGHSQGFVNHLGLFARVRVEIPTLCHRIVRVLVDTMRHDGKETAV